MLVSGNALVHSFTLQFVIHGERGKWRLTLSGPGPLKLERETRDDSPYVLLDEMLTAGFKQCFRDFPGQAPPEPPLRRALPVTLPVTETEPALPVPKRKAFSRRASR
jgi:hypothetical protein